MVGTLHGGLCHHGWVNVIRSTLSGPKTKLDSLFLVYPKILTMVDGQDPMVVLPLHHDGHS